jgi:anti-sigma-K factor RskA
MADTATCPTLRDGDDGVARQYASGAMSAEAAQEFEAHLADCHRCQKAVEYAAAVTATLRGAAHARPPSIWERTPWLMWAIPAVLFAGLVIGLTMW